MCYPSTRFFTPTFEHREQKERAYVVTGCETMFLSQAVRKVGQASRQLSRLSGDFVKAVKSAPFTSSIDFLFFRSKTAVSMMQSPATTISKKPSSEALESAAKLRELESKLSRVRFSNV